MRLRSIIEFGLVLSSAAVLAACSSGGASTPTSSSAAAGSGSGSATSTPRTSAGGASGSAKVSITYEYFNNQPAAIKETKNLVAQFEKKYPNISVRLQVAPADSLEQKLQTQYVGGIAPDVVQNDAPGDTLQFAQYLANLSQLLPKSFSDDIPPSVREGLTQNGQLLAVPTEQQSYVVFANSKIFKQDGVKIPTGATMSWDEFANLAKQTTKGDVKGLVWGMQVPASNFASFGLGFGAKFFTSTTQSDAKATIGKAELAVPTRVKAMIDEGYINKTAVPESTSDALPIFYAGKAAMTVVGSYQIANISSDAPAGFQWSVLPALAGSTGAQQMSAPITLAITKTSKHLDAAAKFVEFYQSPENLAAINIADGEIPATVSAQQEAAKLTAGKNGWAQILASGKNLVNPTWNTFTKYEDWKSTVANPGYQQYLAGKISASQLASQLESGWAGLK